MVGNRVGYGCEDDVKEINDDEGRRKISKQETRVIVRRRTAHRVEDINDVAAHEDSGQSRRGK